MVVFFHRSGPEGDYRPGARNRVISLDAVLIRGYGHVEVSCTSLPPCGLCLMGRNPVDGQVAPSVGYRYAE